ncbi:hypothetical protein [Lysinibacillus odysseyi]|nr:hypothetical protein [Lysinibacillus odysseyi]
MNKDRRGAYKQSACYLRQLKTILGHVKNMGFLIILKKENSEQ